MTDTTREAASPVPGAQPDEHEGGNLVRLNARTAKRQQLLLAGVGAVLLVGGSWFIFGSDDPKQDGKAGGGETIDTAGLVNRDLSQREFVAVYGNRLDAVSRRRRSRTPSFRVPRSKRSSLRSRQRTRPCAPTGRPLSMPSLPRTPG